MAAPLVVPALGKLLGQAAFLALLSGGLPGETYIDPATKAASTRGAVSHEQVQRIYNRYIKQGKTPEEANRLLAGLLTRARPQGMAALRSRFGMMGKLGRFARVVGGVGGAAITPLFAAQMLFPSAFMPSMPEMEGMEGMAAGGMGGPPTGEEGELMQLLGGLQQEANQGSVESRLGAARARGEGGMLSRMQAMSSGNVPQMGLAPGLEDLIERNRQRISELAVRRRPSFAEIMAQEGFYVPDPAANMASMFGGMGG
jgi:hypothetical protein